MRNKSRVLSAVSGTVLAVAAQVLPASAAAHSMPLRGLCAHQGGMQPGNTVPAFVSAVRKGAAMVEFDVQRCKSGELVVMHNNTVDATTNGKGAVKDLSWREIKELRVKAPLEMGIVRVPSFDEAIDCFPKSGVYLNVHCRDDVAAEVARKIKEKGRLHQAFIACSRIGMASARAAVPEVKICLFATSDPAWLSWLSIWSEELKKAYVDEACARNVQFIQPRYSDWTEGSLDRFHASGGKVNYYRHLLKPEMLQDLIDMGVDFPLVDDLDAFLAEYATCRKVPDPFVGHWSFRNARCGWLDVACAKDGTYGARLLWGDGVPEPCKVLRRGGVMSVKNAKHVLSFQVKGDMLKGQIDGREVSAVRIPKPWSTPVSPWDKREHWIRYGKPIDLLAEGLEGWEIIGNRLSSDWSFAGGVLSGRAKKGRKNGSAANRRIRTKGVFADFKISFDVRVPKDCDAGVFLRGLYEVQIADSFGKKPDVSAMGAVHGRIAPAVSAEKHPGEWQHVEAELFMRHVTVFLNGVKVIDKAPLEGVTGGAISTDVYAPGPIVLQGGATGIDFKDVVLVPIL